MKNKFYKTVSFNIFLIALVIFGFLIFQVVTLNLLPLSIFLIMVLGTMFVLILFLLLCAKWKLLGNILLCLSIAIFSLGNIYVYKAHTLLKNVSDTNKNVVNFSVVALKERVEKPSSLGILSIGNLEFQYKALEQIEESYTIVEINSYEKFINDLYEENVDSILVASNSIELIEEYYPSFIEDVKVIQTVKVEMESQKVSSDIDIVHEPFNIYISGKDAEGIDNLSRSDVNIIMSINPSTHQILMTGVPRDFYIPQTCQNNQQDKLTHTGMFGIACTVDSMENFMQVPIDYYVEVNFNSLINVVDSLGGITVNSPLAFTAGGYEFVVGENEMDGQKALAFSRERYSFEDGDRERSRNQMRVLTAIINKAMSPSIIGHYSELLDTLSTSFKTNLSKKEITSFIKSQLMNMQLWNIQQIQVNGYGDSVVSPALGFEVYVMVPYEDTVQDAEQLIQKILDNEEITQEDINNHNQIVNK